MEAIAKKSSWLKVLLMVIRGDSQPQTTRSSDRQYRGTDLF